VGSVIAQNQGSGVQILAAFVSPAGAFVITYSNRLRCGYIVMPGQRLGIKIICAAAIRTTA
jgi:hypothetical protein